MFKRTQLGFDILRVLAEKKAFLFLLKVDFCCTVHILRVLCIVVSQICLRLASWCWLAGRLNAIFMTTIWQWQLHLTITKRSKYHSYNLSSINKAPWSMLIIKSIELISKLQQTPSLLAFRNSKSIKVVLPIPPYLKFILKCYTHFDAGLKLNVSTGYVFANN